MNMRKNFVLGTFLVGGLIALTGLTFYLRGGVPWGDRVNWTAYFGRDSVVREGWEVFTSGKKIGLVQRVDLVSEEEMVRGRFIKATLRIDSDVTLWEGAEVVLVTRGLLGVNVVQVRRGDHTKRRLSTDTPLFGRVAGGLVSELTELVKENREGLSRIVEDLEHMTGYAREGKGTLGKAIYDEELYRKFLKIADDLSMLGDSLNDPDTTLGKLIGDRELYDEFLEGARHGREILARFNQGPLGKLVDSEELAASVKSIVADVRSLLDRLEKGEGALGLLLTDARVREDVQVAVTRLRGFTERLDSDDGSLSALLNDKGELYENIRAFSADLRKLSRDIRAGQGTLGLLLKDDRVYNELLRMLEAFREGGEVARENAPLSSFTSFASLFFNVLN